MQAKNVKVAAIVGGILAAIGIIVVIRKIRNATPLTMDADPNAVKNTPPLQAPASDFPLKNGSRNNLVKQLQELLGLTADGIFGVKTQAALLLRTAKTSITSQAEFDAVIKTLLAQKQQEAAQAVASSKGQKSQKIINDYNANKSWKVMTLRSFRAHRYNMDAYGTMTPSGFGTDLKANETFARQSIEMVGVGGSGDVRIKVTSYSSTLPAGYYLFDPSNITLVP